MGQTLFQSNRRKFFRVVTNMYENIKSCVKSNKITSTFFEDQCRIRQGENISPMFFFYISKRPRIFSLVLRRRNTTSRNTYK